MLESLIQFVSWLETIVDRHPPELTENINELVDYGLVELTADSTNT